MNITTFSDYTLRVLIYLATHEGEKSTADEIASVHHVAKAGQWLAREGYVNSERGRAGGMTLQQDINTINIGRVVKATEAGTALVDCMRTNGGTCCIRPRESFTLADIVTEKTALKMLLAKTA